MRNFKTRVWGVALMGAALFCLAVPVMSQDTAAPAADLKATLVNEAGKEVGTAAIRSAPDGSIITVEVSEMAPGWHGLHVHAVGDCADHADHFKKAGAHLADADEKHGFMAAEGPHKGDLPNIWVHTDGTAKVELFSDELEADDLMDKDGSAIMIHAAADDHKTDPSGSSGERLACGVVKR